MVKFIKICDQNPCRFNFGNFSTQLPYPLSPPPPTLPRSTWQKIDLETLFERNRWFPSVCEVMIKTWGAVLIAAWGIINKFNFLTHKCIYIFASNLNTINLKLFHNHGGIYRFRKKIKKNSGEINSLESIEICECISLKLFVKD